MFFRSFKESVISYDSGMEKYLCEKSALDYWKIPAIKGYLELEDIEFPPEFVIFTDESVYRPENVYLHTCGIQGAEKYVIGKVCSLPLVFLQLANRYNIHQLIYLGMQICSYREGKGIICERKDLLACAKELKGHRGRRKALRALKYIQEGSRSPMESILYMFLSLPNALGGCGFRNLELNKKIDLTRKNKGCYYADIYSEKNKLIIEYDSFKYHNNNNSFSKDSVRQAILESEGYQVLSVKACQLFTLANFEILAKNIAKRIGKKIRIRAQKFFLGFVALTKLLKKTSNKIRKIVHKIRLKEVPHFSGIKDAYQKYLDAYNKLERYPLKIPVPG